MIIRISHVLLLALLCPVIGLSQSSMVSIKGKIDIAESSDVVQISKPVGGIFNIFFTDEADDAVVQNKSFSMKLVMSTNAFIRLQSKGLPKFVCYVDSACDIDFEVKTDNVTKKQQVVFYGCNAKGNELMANRRLLNNGGEDQVKIISIIQVAPNCAAAMQNLHIVLLGYTNAILALYENHEITKNCCNALIAETEQRLLFWCKDVVSEGLKNPLSLKMNSSELKMLINNLYSEYDPFGKQYINTTTLGSTIEAKCHLISDSVLRPVQSKPGNIWRSFAKQFEAINGSFGIYDYATDYAQIHGVGNALLTALVFNPMTESDFLKVFKTYYSIFPNSPYNSIINGELLGKITKVENTSKQKDDKLVYLDSAGIITSQTIEACSNMHSLIKNNFSGKAVFVDYWATFCGPCKDEFKHESFLNDFLRKNNIILLYVSLDNDGSEENWMKFIQANKMKGIHFFSNKAVKDALGKEFSGIPRYMLYNKQGKLVENNAERPSTHEKLFSQINERLGIRN